MLAVDYSRTRERFLIKKVIVVPPVCLYYVLNVENRLLLGFYPKKEEESKYSVRTLAKTNFIVNPIMEKNGSKNTFRARALRILPET